MKEIKTTYIKTDDGREMVIVNGRWRELLPRSDDK